MNAFFKDAVSSLDIPMNTDILTHVDLGNIKDPIDRINAKFSSHPSILKMKEIVNPSSFSFKGVFIKDIEMELANLNPKKATTFKTFLQR